MQKKYYRCNVCGDIHYGFEGLDICPTCLAKFAYCEIDTVEANNLMFGKVAKENKTSEPNLIKMWDTFTKKSDFILNPDSKVVELVAKGVNQNELKSGLKLCPCRLPDKTRERDLELICPCNFKIQETWENRGSCWCDLFVKPKGP